MEFTLNNRKNTKHAILVLSESIKVIRLQSLGGTPSTINIKIECDAGFRDVMKKLSTIINFDDDMYAMMAEHTKDI